MFRAYEFCKGLISLSRHEIAEVYYVLEVDYHVSGVLQERKSNQRRRMSTGFQIKRTSFRRDFYRQATHNVHMSGGLFISRAAREHGYYGLDLDQQVLYCALCEEYGVDLPGAFDNYQSNATHALE